MTADSGTGRPWWMNVRGAVRAAPRTVPDPPRRILLVSNGTPIGPDVLRAAIELGTPEHAKFTVLGIARVYGTAFGLPNPGLQPTRREWEELRTYVNDAADVLRRKGFEVRVATARARNAPKIIGRWVTSKSFHAVVVPDPDRPRWRRTIEGDLAAEIRRRAGVPVHAVPVPAPPPSHRSAGAR